MQDKLKYWFPRLIIIGFAVSMLFSTPEFIRNMDEPEFIVWLLRLLWVLAFPILFCLLLMLTLLVKNHRQGKRD